MPIEAVPGTDLTYLLIAFDADGSERSDDPDAPSGAGGRLSAGAALLVAEEPVTDVFLMSHGWRGDIPAARAQYGQWVGAMAACTDDIVQMRAARPGFRPLLIGLHWPSEPWGDESLGGDGVSFGVPGDAMGAAMDRMVDHAAARTADTPAARAALRTIFRAAIDDPAPPTLPPDVRAAYATLNSETGLGSAGPAAAPGDDRDPFDAEAIYQATLAEEVNFGGFGNTVLEPLRLLSFWQMKARACTVGERGIHGLLRALLDAGADRGVRVHLMGHSFGGIVVSAAVAGPPGSAALPRPVSSLVLVQGALSLWSYCTDIPPAPGKAGHFRSIVEGGRVDGPIVVTSSVHDTAVGALYPRAAGVAGLFGDQVSFDPASLPKYGASGTFGMRGPGLQIEDRELGPLSEAYALQAGTIYNLECSQVICEGAPPSGAHNDISRPEVAHAVWAAARGAP